jgi:tRNA_anti-like
MTNVRRWYVLATALAVVVFLLPACSGKSDKKGDDKTGDEKKGDTRSVGDPKPDFTLTSKEFAEEYKKDEKAAEAKYKGKVIELSGTVKSVSRSPDRGPFLSLQAGEKDLLGVWCFTTDRRPWLRATPGQTVKLRGKCNPRKFELYVLLKCVVTDVSGEAPVTLRADELAQEYAVNQDGTTKKYENKYLFLTGEIDKVTSNKANAASVVLKTTGTTKVFANFIVLDKAETAGLKEGRKIKLLGKYSLLPPSNVSKDEVGLHECIPVEGSN